MKEMVMLFIFTAFMLFLLYWINKMSNDVLKDVK